MARMRHAVVAVLGPVLFAIACFVPATAAGQGNRCYQVINVDPLDVLYIRSRKDHRSKAVGAIAPNHATPIIGTGACTPSNASRRKQWCPVDYYPLPDVRRSGFVKAYYIKSVACR